MDIKERRYLEYLEGLLEEAESNYGKDSSEYEYVKDALDEFNRNFEV